MSQISQLVHRILAAPGFAYIFFYATWVFVAVSIVAVFLVVAFQPRGDYVHPADVEDGSHGGYDDI